MSVLWLMEPDIRLTQFRSNQAPVQDASVPSVPETDIHWALHNAQAELERRRQLAGIKPGKRPEFPAPDWLDTLIPLVKAPEGEPAGNDTVLATATVTVHPGILAAMLKQKLEAAGRIYLLLKAIDRQGRGWLAVDEIRCYLTNKNSPLCVCSWRRLRQLFTQGEALFWQRDPHGRLWLKGAHKIAYKLKIGRLQGFPVALPITTLLSGIQAVRAHFYASFHSGRDDRPISRQRLQVLSDTAPRTQRAYDKIAQVKRCHNLAIGERYTQVAAQERAWKQGRGVFLFIDTQGQQGPPHHKYLAWQLPNSYRGPHDRRAKGSRKRLNRKLAGLVHKGIPGNDGQAIEQVFWPDGALAAKRYNRNPHHDAYWPYRQSRNRQTRLWAVIVSQEN